MAELFIVYMVVNLSVNIWSLWASLVAQLIKNLPIMQETWVRSLGCEDPLEKGKVTHSSILAWRIPWTIVHGVAKSQTRLSNFTFTFFVHITLIPTTQRGQEGG